MPFRKLHFAENVKIFANLLEHNKMIDPLHQLLIISLKVSVRYFMPSEDQVLTSVAKLIRVTVLQVLQGLYDVTILGEVFIDEHHPIEDLIRHLL